jgi:uncharacterized protein YecT (DUF1311 family)
MFENSQKIRTEVEELEAKLRRAMERLDAAEQAEAALSEEQRLAVELHELTCHANHTDGCGWFYEQIAKQHDWGGITHVSYLRCADRLLVRAGSVESAWAMLEGYRTIKNISRGI